MPDDGLETVVAGIRCRDVLTDLSAFLDGELDAPRLAQLKAHLDGCDRCSRFGGAVSHVLTRLREGLALPTALPSDTAARLHASVAAAMRE
jgi:anti-sigma factor RsiW